MEKILLNKAIEEEKNGVLCSYIQKDKEILEKIYFDIYHDLGVQISYLSELNYTIVKGSGRIIEKYIHLVSSEVVKAYLLNQMVYDRTPQSAKKILKMYFEFKASEFYISPVGKPSSAHIYVRYDNAFNRLKSREICGGLLELATNFRDACYLPLTMKMLASWKLPQMKDNLDKYLGVKLEDLQNEARVETGMYPSAETMKRDLTFIAISGMKYYPDQDVVEKLQGLASNPDLDIRQAANKVLKVIRKSN